MLPDSTTNEPESHGFFRYKIAPKTSVNTGQIITNTAHIFFDYNAPIATNTTSTLVQSSTSVQSHTLLQHILYPNPSSGLLHVQGPDVSGGQILVYDLLGKEIAKKLFEHSIDLNHAMPGLYIVLIKDKDGKLISSHKVYVQK